MRSKKLIAIGIFILAGLGFFLRGRIFSLMKSFIPVENMPVAQIPLVTKPSPVEFPKVNPPPSPAEKPPVSSAEKMSVASQYPVYHGRDPQEVRSVPEEVKLFSEEQKKKIYSEIENYGQAVKVNPGFFAGWLQGLGGCHAALNGRLYFLRCSSNQTGRSLEKASPCFGWHDRADLSSNG